MIILSFVAVVRAIVDALERLFARAVGSGELEALLSSDVACMNDGLLCDGHGFIGSTRTLGRSAASRPKSTKQQKRRSPRMLSRFALMCHPPSEPMSRRILTLNRAKSRALAVADHDVRIRHALRRERGDVASAQELGDDVVFRPSRATWIDTPRK